MKSVSYIVWNELVAKCITSFIRAEILDFRVYNHSRLFTRRKHSFVASVRPEGRVGMCQVAGGPFP